MRVYLDNLSPEELRWLRKCREIKFQTSQQEGRTFVSTENPYTALEITMLDAVIGGAVV